MIKVLCNEVSSDSGRSIRDKAINEQYDWSFMCEMSYVHER